MRAIIHGRRTPDMGRRSHAQSESGSVANNQHGEDEERSSDVAGAAPVLVLGSRLGRRERGGVPGCRRARRPAGGARGQSDPGGRLLRHRHRAAAVQGVRDRDVRRIRQDRAAGRPRARGAGRVRDRRPAAVLQAAARRRRARRRGRLVGRRDRHARRGDAARVAAADRRNDRGMPRPLVPRRAPAPMGGDRDRPP